MNRIPSFVQSALVTTFLLAFTRSTPGDTLVLRDNYNVTSDSSTGFGLNQGANLGIDPPVTRLEGIAASNLRYIKTGGTRPDANYSIANSRLRVLADGTIGRFTLSENGLIPFDFSAALRSDEATPANPVVYDVKVEMRNDATGTAKLSFGIATAEGDVTTWDFGLQIYRAASGHDYYTLQGRIDNASSGNGDINEVITTTAPTTYKKLNGFLIRITDAGAETTTYNSRVQVSLDNGVTWDYDSRNDSELPNGWRFDAPGRYLVWDQAGNSADAFYDDVVVTAHHSVWNGAASTDDHWSTAANWIGSAPSASGESIIFSGSTRLTPLMQDSYSIRDLRFDPDAGPFSIGTAESTTLTLGGDIIQNAANLQTLAAPLSIAGVHTINTAAGDLTLDGEITGVGALRKTGDHALTLGAANSYEGDTTVSAGTLFVNGSISGGSVTVQAGATLGGNGSINAPLSLEGTIAPGLSAGALATGSQTWHGGGRYIWEMDDAQGAPGASPGWDLLDAGDATLTVAANAASQFTLQLVSPPGGAANFDPDTTASWQIFASTAVSGFSPNAFAISDTAFLNDLKGGLFSLETDSSGLYVKFTPNQPPTAAPAAYTRNYGASLKIPLADLLTHTSDPENEGTELTLVNNAVGGSVTMDSTYVYFIPDGNSAATFDYTVKDKRAYRAGDTPRTATAEVTIAPIPVTGQAQAPLVPQSGPVTVNFFGIPGYSYQVQRATNLMWSGTIRLWPVTAPATGAFQIQDDFSDLGEKPSQAYYRLEYNP